MLLPNLNLLATAPDGVAKLRELILTLAVQGKLVPQDANDEPASELLKKIRAEKDRLIAEGTIKRDKPLAEVSEEEKPFALPNGWEWVRIPDVTYSLGQGEPSTAFSYIDVAAIDNDKGLVAPDIEVLEAADAPSRARKNVSVGTVLYSTVRPYLKNIAVVERDYRPHAIASTAFAVMHPHVGVLSKYLLHYLRSHPFTEFVNSKAVGIAYPAINDANFFQGIVPLPPLAEQSRIVSRVEDLMRLCDALEAKARLEATQHAQLVATLLATLTASATPEALAENWQRVATHFDLLLDRPEAVDALEQTILQLAVRGLLVPQDPTDEPAKQLLQKIRAEKDRLITEGKIKRDKPLPPIADDEKPFELPTGWEWVRLGSLTELVTSGSRDWAEHYSDSGPIFVRMGNLSRGSYQLRTNHLQHVKPPRGGEGSRTSLEAGDLLLSITGEVGMLGLIPEAFGEAYINQHTCLIRWAQSARNEYLPIELLSAFVQDQFNSPQRGIKNSFRLTDVLSVLLALPPISEQSRIVARVAALRALCALLRTKLTDAHERQSQLAEALVKTAA
jgi:type I restriction enzyme S subunit